MLRRDLTPAFDALIECDLTFDALTLPQHLAPLLELVSRHPDMQVVIDHASKPRISEGAIDGWAADIARFGDLDQVSCKISGMVTEADADWSVADLEPYVAQLLSTFGSERLIWGSDWPVCQLAASYEDWLQAGETLLSPLSPAQRAAIFGLNAARIYKIGH
jgi:L-fuconolactonase